MGRAIVTSKESNHCAKVLVPSTASTTISSGCLSRAAGASSLHGEQITRDALRLIDPGAAERAGKTQGSRTGRRCGWNARMLGFRTLHSHRPPLGDWRSCRTYLEWLVLVGHAPDGRTDIVRRPKATPIHELERYMRCKDCSQVVAILTSGSYPRALRPTKITAANPLSTGGREKR